MRWVYCPDDRGHILFDDHDQDTGLMIDLSPVTIESPIIWIPEDRIGESSWHQMTRDELREWIRDPAAKYMELHL